MDDSVALLVPQFNDDYWMKEVDERCKERLSQPNCVCPPAESVDGDVRDNVICIIWIIWIKLSLLS